MTSLYRKKRYFRKNAAAIEMATLSWPAKHLVRRHGLRAATAKVIAELIGYNTLEDR
jgi:hypothetical protein